MKVEVVPTRWRMKLLGDGDKEIAHVTLKVSDVGISLWDLYVEEAHRRNGYAVQLVELCKAEAVARKCALWLRVHDDNSAAIALYKKCGFKVCEPYGRERDGRIYMDWKE